MKKTFAALSFFSLFLLVGCGPSDTASSTPDSGSEGTSQLTPWVDYASQVTLQLDYQGKDFYTNGVGQMEEFYPIDGDTAHFTPVVKTTSSERIKCRFYGIDTPESTGKDCGQYCRGVAHQITSDSVLMPHEKPRGLRKLLVERSVQPTDEIIRPSSS